MVSKSSKEANNTDEQKETCVINERKNKIKENKFDNTERCHNNNKENKNNITSDYNDKNYINIPDIYKDKKKKKDINIIFIIAKK